MQATNFEIYICTRKGIVRNGLSDLGYEESSEPADNLYAIKRESAKTLWYAKFQQDSEDIVGTWTEILGSIESDDIQQLPRFKKNPNGSIAGLNRIYLNEILRQGDLHINHLKERQSTRTA